MYNNTQPETIQKMFATIAKRYDRTNALLSFGLYTIWNRALVKAIGARFSLLDLCAGTGDIAFAFLKKNPNASALLLDFCPEMLDVAKHKGERLKHRFQTIVADAQEIPLTQEFDAITVAYGIRNVKNPANTFAGAFRLLKKGGVFGILELTRPTNPLLHFGHTLYLKTTLPLLGKWTGKNKEAYSYLSKSIASFSSPNELKEKLLKTGFYKVDRINLMGGSATILLAFK